jgi:hypothetical protein
MKYLRKTIEYGLYLLVFLLPIQTRWIIKAGELNGLPARAGGLWEYGTYSIYATDVLLLILLVLSIIAVVAANPWIAGQARNDKISKGRMVCWFIGGWLLMSAVSVFFAASRLLALYKFSWLILGVGLFWLIVRANYDRLKLLYVMLAGIFLQAVLGIWQFLNQATFSNKWLGLAWHRGGDLGASVIESFGADGVGERWLRAYGGLDHPNILGGILAVGILLLIGQIIMMERVNNFPTIFPAFARRGGTSNFKIFKMIAWAFLVIFSAALFFSFSRSAWLALAAGLAVGLIGAVTKKDLLAQKIILQAVLISGAVAFILFFQYSNLLMTRLYANDRLEIKSVSERLESIKSSWGIIKNHWLGGVGLGNYTLALSQEINPGEASYYYQPAHNVFLLVWAEVGIVGLMFFIGLIIYAFVRLLRRPENEVPRDDKNELAYRDNNKRAWILIALIVIMCFDHWLLSLHFGVLFFWLIAGLLFLKNSPG